MTSLELRFDGPFPKHLTQKNTRPSFAFDRAYETRRFKTKLKKALIRKIKTPYPESPHMKKHVN